MIVFLLKVKNIDSNNCTVITRVFFGFGVGTRRVQKMPLIDWFEKSTHIITDPGHTLLNLYHC